MEHHFYKTLNKTHISLHKLIKLSTDHSDTFEAFNRNSIKSCSFRAVPADAKYVAQIY